jgi:hypothetical protein
MLFICVYLYIRWAGVAQSDYRLVEWDSVTGRGKQFFLQPLYIDQTWGPPSLISNENQGSFPGGKSQLGRDADHSPPSSAEIKNE